MALEELKNLVVVLPRFPYPLNKGDQLRAYHQLKYLSQFFTIHLIALSDCEVSQQAIAALPFINQLYIIRLNKLGILTRLLGALFTGLPFQVAYFTTPFITNRLQELIKNIQPHIIYNQLIRTGEYRQAYSSFSSCLDYQDCFSSALQRRAERAPFYSKWLIKWEERKVRRYEQQLFANFNHSTIITERDRNELPFPNRDQVHIIPNGVDLEKYKRRGMPQKECLIFTGNMNYEPNVDCALFLVNDVFPLIKKKFPNATLILAGVDPHPTIKKVAQKDIIVTGKVDDMCTIYEQGSVFLAPMRTGAGLQNKLLEAMAMNIPCVTSTLCNLALKANNGHDLFIADTPMEVANRVEELFTNELVYQEMALHAHEFVRKNYSWDSQNKLLKDILLE